MSIGTVIKVGLHLLKIGGKATKSKVTGKPSQLSPSERKALELIGKGPKVGKDKLLIKK